MFFVSIASKGLSQDVSLWFATLAGKSISVAAKGVKTIVGGPQPVGAGSVHGAKETTGSAIGVVEGQAGERLERVPEWELLVHPPAVFVRVATAGLTGYGTGRVYGTPEERGDRQGWDSIYAGENSTPY